MRSPGFRCGRAHVQVFGKHSRPEIAELTPFAKLKVSVNKCAYMYCEKHLGAWEEVGNKGSLSNRLHSFPQIPSASAGLQLSEQPH
jgi:hypothetical protein